MAIQKKGLAHWAGDLKHGKGTVSTESGALSQQPYGFNTRFEGVKGTNPEELIGAAHAACQNHSRNPAASDKRCLRGCGSAANPRQVKPFALRFSHQA